MSQGPQKGVVVGLILLLVCIAAGTAGFMLIERWSVVDSFFMTVISITTVGYQEVHPLSPEGQVFASAVILLGLGIVFFTTTMLGRVILEGEFRGTLERRRMRKTIEKLKDHQIVCGYGRTGKIVVEELVADGYGVCVIDNDSESEPLLRELGCPYIIADATEEQTLKTAGVERAAGVMALLPSDADNLYLTMNAKELNPAVKLVTRAFDDMAERRLKQVGADHVVATYKIAGHRVMQAALRPTVDEFFDLVSDRQQLSLFLEEVQLVEKSVLVGLSLADAGVRNNYGVIVIAIKKPDGGMLFNPEASEVLSVGDILIAIGEKAGLLRLGDACKVSV
jgi:voltage-gated potassium channel